ncbi:SET domain containing protein [Reticulomyxa filosa]|uniref:SET domain containing protein n=1 Tax=Reticulomyxa filosa TaxID=46433 RepID=X6NJ84_RETFI|nr:SET domain containing protein [Reticulomyxa filosa]|eukprot:ETO26066.1 SET domain containing protein [Reticulomyxa filosa]
MPKGKGSRKGRPQKQSQKADSGTTSEGRNDVTSSGQGAVSTNEPQPVAEQLKDQGNKEFQKGHFDRAVDYYSRALKEDAADLKVLSNRSAAYVALEKFDLAIEDAQECIRKDPKWWKVLFMCIQFIFSSSPNSLLLCQQRIKEIILRKNQLYIYQIIAIALLLLDLAMQIKICIVSQRALHDMDIKRINTLQRSDRIVGGYHPQAEKFRCMFNWLLKYGAKACIKSSTLTQKIVNKKFPKLYLKFFSPEFRAINATDKIQKDEDVMYIPHDCIMTSEVAKASHLGQAITDSGIELKSKHSYLAGYLCEEREKGKASHWYPYIDILPRNFETVPIFFGQDKLDMLKGSIAIKKIEDRNLSLRAEYDNICAHVPEFRRIPYKDFVWGRLVVITRIFGLVIDDNKTDGLVPMADMLNHKRPRETKWTYEQKRRGFVVTALQTIEKNTEVFDSYGRKCNSRFFVNYGFSLEDNEDNEASLTFELSRSDPQYLLKSKFLGIHAFDQFKKIIYIYILYTLSHTMDNVIIFTSKKRSQREFQIPRQYKEKKVLECFSWLRVAFAQGNEFMIISAQNVQNDEVVPVSVQNEMMVLTAIAVAAKKSLNQFDTTLEDDNELLKDEEKYPRFSNMRNIVLMRRGEKEVLHFYLNLLKECKPLLYMKSKDLKQKIAQEKKWKTLPDDPLVQYVTSVVVPLVTKQL